MIERLRRVFWAVWPQVVALWDRLVEPNPAIFDRETQQQARVLAVLSLTLTFFYTIPELLRWATTTLSPLERGYILVTASVVAVAYVFSRTRRPAIGAWLLVLVFMAGPMVGLFGEATLTSVTVYRHLGWGITALVIGALLLPLEQFVIFFLLGSVALLLAAHVLGIPLVWIRHPLAIFGVVSLLLTIIVGTRKRFFQSLEASERRFRELFAATLDALVVHDGQRIVEVNPPFEAMFGYSRDHALTKHPLDLVAAQDAEAIAHAIRHPEAQEGLVRGFARRADGSLFPAEIKLGAIHLEGRSLQAVSIRDISRRVAAENQARLLLQAAEQSANAIVITDKAGNIEYVNPAFTRMTGYALAEVQGRNPRLLKSGHHPPAFYQQMWATLLQGEIWQGEILNRRKDGSLYWERETITPIVDEQGQIVRFIAIKEDITAQKAAEEQIRLLQAAVEQSRTAIFIVKPDGTVEYANPAAEQLTGYHRSSILGAPLAVISPSQMDSPRFAEMLTHVRQYRPWAGALPLQHKDGTVRWAYISIAPILDDQDIPARFVVVMEDITQQKELEAALRQARDEALEANRLKTSLLAHVSHDMRTPLGGILGFAEMMLEGALGPLTTEQRDALHHILERTRTLVDFTNDLIHQAELESGRLRLQPQVFAPGDLLKVLPSYVGLAEAKGVKVYTYIDPQLPPQVTGDLYWLRRLLANLLSNATKFTDQGEIWIRLLHQDEGRWAIQVEDTGIGIPAEMQQTIFEPFRQADESPTRRYGGSGLGLSIVQQLVELMHGEITLHSVPGQGSVFTVILPCQLALHEE